jgi:rod shape-determining protein MreD
MRETVLKDIFRAFLAAAAAVLVYSLAGAAGPFVLVVLNAFSIVVVYFSVRRGEVFGAFLGTACGLVQDAFSLSVFGLAGLTKTLLGFFTGYVSRRIDVSAPPRLGIFLLVASTLELGAWLLLSSVVRQEPILLHGGRIFLQPLVTALSTVVLVVAGRRFQARRREA